MDLQTGIVVSRAINFLGKSVYIHPYTGVQIIGTKIPEWKKVLESVKDAHKMVPELGYVAWDVVVCEDFSVTFIEGNTGGGVDIQQCPMLIGVRPIYDILIKKCRKKI